MRTANEAGVPPSAGWTRWRDGIQTVGLVLLGLTLCTSVAGVNMAKVVLLLVFLTYLPQLPRLAPWREPAIAAGLILLLFISVVSVAHNGFSRSVGAAFKHYQELLIAPILFVLLRTARHPRYFFYALLLGAIGLACAHWYALLGAQTHDLLNSRRISAGFMLSVSAFVALVLSVSHARPWPLRALAAALALTTMFAVGGRTGYVVLLILALYAAGSLTLRRWRWPALTIAAALLVVAAISSEEVRSRVEETVGVATRGFASDAVKQTSTAIRVHMLHISRDIVEQHGVIGLGYAGYGDAYRLALAERVARDPTLYATAPDIWTHSDNPHSEYLMQLLGGGIFGLALFGLWLLVILRQAARLPDPYRRIVKGLCLAFAVGCLFNSLLLDFVEGHFFVALLAFSLYAGQAARARPPP